MSKDFLYKQIEDDIRKRIQDGTLKPGDKLGTTKKLAESFQASIITINKALSNLVNTGFITRTPRLGSTVNPESEWQHNLNRAFHTQMIGAIVFDTASPYLWAKALKGMELVLQEHSYHLVIGNDEGDIHKAMSYINDLSNKGIEGFIIVPIGKESLQEYEEQNLQLLHSVEATGVPYIFFHRHIESQHASVVATENYSDAHKMILDFLASGIKNPICISHYYDTVVAERERGFCDALRRFEFEQPEKRIFKTHPRTQNISVEANAFIADILRKTPDVDGIFTLSANLLLATFATIDSLHDERLEKIQFATFDYSDAMYQNPQVRMMMIPPALQMGKVAAEILLDTIHNKSNVTTKTLLPSTFLKKD